MSYNSRNRLETVIDTGATGTRSFSYDNRAYDNRGHVRRVKSIKQTATG